MAIDVNQYRHEREKLYFTLAAGLGALTWLAIIVGTVGLAIVVAIALVILLWITQQFFKASVYGDAALVSSEQYPEIHKMVLDASKTLGLAQAPTTFVLNGEGNVNAFAVRFVTGKYVVLFSGLVDLLLEDGRTQELKMIIGHEVGHHAAGHVGGWKQVLAWPAMVLPYLGPAYRRACELTADRLGAIVSGDIEAAKRGLVATAVGSRALKTNIPAFIAQEAEIPPFFGYMHQVYSSHPRMTRRLMALSAFAPNMPKRRAKTGPLLEQAGQTARVPQAEATTGAAREALTDA